MSLILSIGNPVWRPIVEIQSGQWRFVFAWFSLIIVTFDMDKSIGKENL